MLDTWGWGGGRALLRVGPGQRRESLGVSSPSTDKRDALMLLPVRAEPRNGNVLTAHPVLHCAASSRLLNMGVCWAAAGEGGVPLSFTFMKKLVKSY